jgi:hypothetical protein
MKDKGLSLDSPSVCVRRTEHLAFASDQSDEPTSTGAKFYDARTSRDVYLNCVTTIRSSVSRYKSRSQCSILNAINRVALLATTEPRLGTKHLDLLHLRLYM